MCRCGECFGCTAPVTLIQPGHAFSVEDWREMAGAVTSLQSFALLELRELEVSETSWESQFTHGGWAHDGWNCDQCDNTSGCYDCRPRIPGWSVVPRRSNRKEANHA